MKHKITALISVISCIALLGGCGGNSAQTSEPSDSVINETSSNTDGETSSNTDGEEFVFADFVGEYPENPLTILTLNEDEIRQLINNQSNFKCAENLYINIPESATVYEFGTYGVHVPQFVYPAAQYKEDFEASFRYFFPDRELNMDYLKYSKYLDWDPEQGTIFDEGYVKDKETLPDQLKFVYDEMPERTESWSYPIYMYQNIEIGCGSGLINKGEAAYLAGKTEYNPFEGVLPSTTYNRLALFEPAGFFETVGKYSPDSEESFNLLDGEMKICDAVDFFESYINNAPISTGLQRNTYNRVYNVEVLKIGDNTYGYYFNTQEEFQGVNFEPSAAGSGNMPYGYDPLGGEAFMIRHDDVDYMCTIFGNAWTFDVNPCEKIIPIETAIENISNKLTDAITFEVMSVEFVYVQLLDKDENGYVNIDTHEAAVTPAWRITAANQNDECTYICYVDAVDGKNFRYYTRRGITYYD